MNSKYLRTFLERKKGEKNRILQDIKQLEETATQLQRSLKRHEQAKDIVLFVSTKTQEHLQYHIGDITSLALDTIFKDPYTLELDFVERRNKTECDLYFSRDGERVEPKIASGGGAIDVAAFAMRVASWSLESPRTRNTIILDEPMKFVSISLRDKAAQMLKEVSTKLGIQFIIVTHDPVLSSYADKVFNVVRRKLISKVSQQENE